MWSGLTFRTFRWFVHEACAADRGDIRREERKAGKLQTYSYTLVSGPHLTIPTPQNLLSKNPGQPTTKPPIPAPI